MSGRVREDRRGHEDDDTRFELLTLEDGIIIRVEERIEYDLKNEGNGKGRK